MLIETTQYEACLNELPQGANCIDFFRKRFLNHMSEDLNKRVWIAGGAIRDYFSEGRITKDVDFFAVDRKSMAELVLLLRKKFQYKHYLITKNAIKGHVQLWGKKIDVDIVKKPFPNPVSCADAFDFTVCCFAVSFDKFIYHKSAAFDLMKRRLVVHNLPHPVDSMKRMNKYIKKGFTACNGTILSIAKAVNQLDAANTNDIFEFYKFD